MSIDFPSLLVPVSILFVAVIIFVMCLKIYKYIRSARNAHEEIRKIAQLPINNPNPLVQVTLDGDILFINPAAENIFPDLRKRIFGHEVLSGLDEFIGKAKKNAGKKQALTREITHRDQVYHQTISSVVVNGKPALVAYFYNITEIKKAQEKARLLEAAIVNAKDGVIITKADLDNPEIVFVNEAVTRLSGYEAEELIGQTPRILQGSGTSRLSLNDLRDTLEKGKSFKGELQNYTKDGIAYWLDISIVPVKDEQGNITHFAAIERDVTQRKAFEKEMQIHREAAEVSNRAKGDFLANMSHELRTPMNGIIGLSELLMEMKMNGEQKELADAVNSSARNLLILLNDILDLSKIEAGELTLENIPFDTRRAVRQTVDLLRPIASRKGVVLESTINPIVPERLMGDPARLQQIMSNLIGNAIKFTDVGYVKVDITSARDKAGDPVLFVRVEDTGIGIPEDKREVIFEKFIQADVSTARKYGGTGLGLAITKELVEMMGGVISVESAEGKGTTFYVEIPVEVAAKSEVLARASVSEVPINTSAKIMVVDDHPINLLFMRKVLKKLGFADVDEAICGKDAIGMAEKKKYDLIFMDCQMPEIDGFEASTIIREREELIGDVTIIAVTADAMKGAREKCLDAGMNEYISKPVDVEKLKAVLGEWLPGKPGDVVSSMFESEKKQAPGSTDAYVLDWDRLRMFTDGDPEEERQLVEMFITYAEETLAILKERCVDGADEEWKKAAHKLKGSAANLGAQALSDKCFAAEKEFDSDSGHKKEILENILTAYRQVTEALDAEKIVA